MYLNYVNWMAIIVLGLGLFASSCSKNEAAKPDNKNTVNLKKKAEKPKVYDHWFLKSAVPSDVVTTNCALIAGQHINVGQVLYWNTVEEVDGKDVEFLYVKYMANDPLKLYEVHLYVGSKEGMPLNKNGSPRIGWFPYSDDNMDGLAEITIKIDISKLGDCFVIAAHAVVIEESSGNNETAWTKCGPMITLKTWIKDIPDLNKPDEYTPFWATIEGMPVSVNPKAWCRHMNSNTFVDINNYELVSPHYPAYPVPVGKIYTAIDENNLIVEITTSYKNLFLDEAYLYIGTRKEFISKYYKYNCPSYKFFPYQKTGISSNIYTFKIALTDDLRNLFSSEEFSSSRWGWYSEYYLVSCK